MANLSRRTVVMASAALAGCALTGRPRAPAPLVALRIGRDRTEVLSGTAGLDADSLTQVASLSKPVFAAAVLTELQARGAGPQTSLGALAPLPYRHRQRGGSDEVTDPHVAALTVSQVLAHRTGLPNWSRTAPLGFEAEPGAGWRYSGEGYRLLQEVVERAWSWPLQALVSRHVFTPLAMPRSTYEATSEPVVDGHDTRGQVVAVARERRNAATSLVSTAAEYARFVQWLLAGGPVASAMLEPQVLVDAARDVRWGLGLGLSEGCFFHWGVNPGYRALVVGSPPRGEAVLALASSDSGMVEAAAQVRAVLGPLKLLTFPMMFPPD